MSLMDLYGSVPGMRRGPWDTPGIGDGVPAPTGTGFGIGADQGAVDYYASQPRQEPKKGGGLGEILKTLFAGALDGVASHYGFRPGGYETMMQQREDERQQGALMQRLMAERAQQEWKWANEPRQAPDLPASVQEANWLNDPQRTPQEIRAYFQAKGPTLVVSNGNTQAYNRDGTPYGGAAPTAPVGRLTPLPEGGGAVAGPGNFRR